MTKRKEETSSGKVKISFNIPAKLLTDMDSARLNTKQSRSDWLSLAVMEKLAKTKRKNEQDAIDS